MNRLFRINLPLSLGALLLIGLVSSSSAADFRSQITDRSARHDAKLSYLLSDQPIQPESAPYAYLSSSSADDLRLSASVTPANFEQSDPTVCVLDDGSIIIAWVDYREGAAKIFMQKLNSSGALVGANIKVAERMDGYSIIEPKLARTVSNKFYIAYRDEASGKIYCKRYNGDMTVDLTQFAISDASVYAGPYSIAARSNGAFIVAYEAYLGSSGIQARRFNSSGALVGASFTVNSSTAMTQRWEPSVVYDEIGGFAVAWEDYRSGTADIYLRVFDSAAAPQTSDVNLVDISAQGYGQYLPSVTYSTIHGYLTGWTDTRDGWEIYFQRYSKTAGLVGANSRITTKDSTLVFSDVAMTTGPSGLLTAVFCRFGSDVLVRAQRYDASLALVGGPQTVNELFDSPPFTPSASVGMPSGKIAIAWQVQGSDPGDIRMHLTDGSLNALIPEEITINSDQSGAVSDQQKLAIVAGTDLYTVFCDQRHDAGDIFLQRSSLANELISENVKLNQDTGLAVQRDPSIGSNGTHFVTSWIDERFVGGVSGTRVFARVGRRNGTFVGSEFQVSGAVVAPKSQSAVGLTGNGIALLAWIDKRGVTPQVFAQRVDTSGTKLGAEFQVSNSGHDLGNRDVVVVTDNQNRFHVVWFDPSAAGGPSVKSRAYTSAGVFLNAKTIVSDKAGYTINGFDAAVDSVGNLFILWTGADAGGSTRIYLSARTQATGAVHLATMEIGDNVTAQPVSPSLSMDEAGNSLMAWVDSRGPERRIYRQNLTSSFTPQGGGNQPVSLGGAPAMFAPDAVAIRGRSWVVWNDARNEGMNVYIAGYVHFPTDVGDDDNSALPIGFSLNQNFPNPFNPTTTISFALPRSENVTLTVYDITGRKVHTLIDSRMNAGEHQISWNGRNSDGATVASGMYLYRLKAGESFVSSKKMTLLK